MWLVPCGSMLWKTESTNQEMSEPVIIKICGITRPIDAQISLKAGADWIGLNFVGGPRRIEPTIAAEILKEIAHPECVVALIEVSNSGGLPAVVSDLQVMGVRRLQVYGEVNARLASKLHALGFQWIVVEHATGPESAARLLERLSVCVESPPSHVLFDTFSASSMGGTGRIFDWQGFSESLGSIRASLPPILLAGGLNAANVAKAIATIRPSGVDVSSGVESAPGKKSESKIREFVAAARSAAKRK